MNVVQRENTDKKTNLKLRKELVRKDSSLGIRGTNSLLPTFTYNPSAAAARAGASNGPRYQFHDSAPSTSKKSSMGPPQGLPRSAKRRATQTTSSTRLESSSSSRPQPRVLAGESAVQQSDYSTPVNRNTALRYISSSSKGGYSGNRSARSSTTAVEASVILALSEGRGMARGEIGIAAVDLRHPHLVLCQFSDTLLYTHTLTKINYFNPVEIIVPHTFCEGVQPSQLYRLIRDQFPLVNLTTVQRRHFNDATGRQQIQTLCAPVYSAVYLQVVHKFYALTAAAAVLKYVEYIQCIVFVRESLKIEYHSSENTMIIDVGTATQLELVQPLVPSAGPTCCLLGILGPTYTIGGIRALRAAILQPSCNKQFIENRLDAVQDLIENDDGLMISLQDVIKKLSEIDKILLLCVESPSQSLDKHGEAQLNQTLLLKVTMDMVPKLVEALTSAHSGRLKKIKIDFENTHYKEIGDRIKTIIQDDAHLERGTMGSLQRCFAVRPDINGLLDVARRTYSELIEDIQTMVEQLGENYDLPLRLNHNAMKGFHIVMSVAPKNRRIFDVEDLPPIFIQKQYTGVSVTMTTEELVVLDHQTKEAFNEIQKMTNTVISGLLKELRPFMSSLYKLCENVAELDILLALAQASSIGSYIRPEFAGYLNVRNCVHPLLDYNSQVTPVNNDIYASPEYNFTIITGPNMGGKSIYIKQVALMQIMAQLGCFVPATRAVLRLCDRLFSRIGFNDSVELNASTFVVEMKEMQHIMTGLTPSSLVIIDELCRGTSTEEGTSMAWAICEQLLISEAFTFFTTHFMYLTRLQDLYFNVVNRHMAVLEEDIPSSQNPESSQKRLVYQHKLEPGATKIEHYGLALATKTYLPKDTVNLAKELAEVIARNRKPEEIRTPEIRDEELLYKLNADIRQESRNHIDSDAIIRKIKDKFKEDHPELIERLRQQRTESNKTDTSVIYSSASNNINTLQPTLKVIEMIKEQHKPKVICNASDDIENSDIDSNMRNKYTNIDNSQTPHKFTNPLLNKFKRSTVIYSTSDDDRNITSVKSSKELLNSVVMDMENDDAIEGSSLNKTIEETIRKRKRHDDAEKANSKSTTDLDETVDNIMTGVDFGNHIGRSYGMGVRNDSDPDVVFLDESKIDENNNTLTSSGSEVSDIADAQTQIIEDFSDNPNLIEIDDSSNFDAMSVDEELAMETIMEIHEDLRSRKETIDDIHEDLRSRQETIDEINEDLRNRQKAINEINEDLRSRQETIYEINEELHHRQETINEDLRNRQENEDILRMILTPPMEFRD